MLQSLNCTFFPILAYCVISKNIACLNMNPNIEKTNGKPCTYDTQPIYPNTLCVVIIDQTKEKWLLKLKL